MNTYEIEGQLYQASNEYSAVREAYKMAGGFQFVTYLGNETWTYRAIFTRGSARVTVRRVRLAREATT